MEDNKKYTILAVDDAKDSLMLLEFDLVDAGYNVLTAESGEAALAVLSNNTVNLILLDMFMPGISGLTTLQRVKDNPSLAHIPIIMLSASDEEEQIVSALELGADDYVTKPYISNVLLARMRNSLRLMENTLQLEALAKTDFLTKVNNRGSYEESVGRVLSQAKRTNENVALAMFDLDFFKNVNDTYGHEAGDKALVDFADILRDTFRDYDVIGRIGGEEFSVCMPNTVTKDAFNACERCRKSLEAHSIEIDYGGEYRQLSVTVSIGITSGSGPLLDFDNLMRIADHSLYQAKENGRNQSNIEEYTESSKSETHEQGLLSENEMIDDNVGSESKFPGIDYSVGVSNVLGDEDLFAEILVMFHQDHSEYGKSIQQAITDGDQSSLKHLVHTLKGVSCSIGAMALFETCKVLDHAVNSEQVSDYPSLFEPMERELNTVIVGIEGNLADKL